MTRLTVIVLSGIVFCACAAGLSRAEEAASGAPGTPSARTLSIQDFIQLVTRHDTVFEEILMDEMKLAYRKALVLPAGDIVLSVKAQYDLILDQDRNGTDVSVSLGKLFPSSGTSVEVVMDNAPSLSADVQNSELNFLVAQPVAENAFGQATRLKDKIVGLEMDVIRYQIVEAYEDYLASLISTYYDWYFAYENLKIGEASYKQNQQLLDNMYSRASNKIALPVDVNKVKLQVIEKEERVITLREQYKNVSQVILKAIRREDKGESLVPEDPGRFHDFRIDFEKGYDDFVQSSRTYAILRLLESKSSLKVDENADALLPSTRLMFGYKVEGQGWAVKNEDNMVYAGVQLDWPFPDELARAQYEVSQIDERKQQLSNRNKFLELYTTLKNLYFQIQREQQLIALADQKIQLAEDVLGDETVNYSYGKITLNDYIAAVNAVDQNRFNKILHTVQQKKLLLEWLRLTDLLVDEGILRSAPQAGRTD